MGQSTNMRYAGGPTRVLHIISVLSVGGAEVWLIELLRHIRATGAPMEFDILMTGGVPNELDSLAASLGAKLHYLRFSRSNVRPFAREFRRILMRGRYHVIHDHQDFAAGWHFFAGAGLLPPKRVVHVHNPVARLRESTDTRLKKNLSAVSQLFVRRFATDVLGTSARILREYGFNSSSFPRQSIRALHCGFDPTPFAQSHERANESVCIENGWAPGSRIALFVGRLNGLDAGNPAWNHKNPQFALEVARIAVNQADLKFVMVGGGEPVESELTRQVEAWGLSDRIALVGARMDVARYMAAGHCLIMPSMEEGLGMVAVEAQAAGLRVLASTGVPREAAVSPELIAFLDLNDGPRAWALRLIQSTALPRADSGIANEAVSRSDFSVASSFAHLQSIYGGHAA